MTPRTKKQLLIGGGVAAGALLLIGGVALLSGEAKASERPAPVATDDDIAKVVDAALKRETDPAILRKLATAMLVLPYSNPLRNKVGTLQARATELEGRVTQSGSETFKPLRQF